MIETMFIKQQLEIVSLHQISHQNNLHLYNQNKIVNLTPMSTAITQNHLFVKTNQDSHQIIRILVLYPQIERKPYHL